MTPTIPAGVTFDVAHASTPSPLYVGVDDSLLWTIFSGSSLAACLLELRILLPNGKIVIQEELLNPTAAFSAFSKVLPLPEGFLLTVSVRASSAAVTRGQVYTTVSLQRSRVPAPTQAYTLIQGYATSNSGPSYPTSLNETSVSGAGRLLVAAATTPGAGANFTRTVDPQVRWRLQGIVVTLVTSAVAGTRVLQIVIDDGATIYQRIVASNTQLASLTCLYSFGPACFSSGVLSAAVNTTAMLQWPILLAGHRIRSLVLALDAGDQLSAIAFGVEEWVDA